MQCALLGVFLPAETQFLDRPPGEKRRLAPGLRPCRVFLHWPPSLKFSMPIQVTAISLKCIFFFSVRAKCGDAAAMPKDTVPASESPVTVRSKAGTLPEVRVVRSQKEIHDAEQTQLAALESISMETLTDYRRSLLAVKIAKLKAKVTLYIVKSSAQTDVVQTKKVRMNFESEDVISCLMLGVCMITSSQIWRSILQLPSIV